MPSTLRDPAEPVNRTIWAANRVLLEGVVQPTAAIYRSVVPQRAREAVGDFGRNTLFPGRLLNESLQGRWKDAGAESLRFLCNTTIGLGGLFDPATHFGIPEPQAEFSQTFQSWGWKPRTYVMLPVFGPSDECAAVATAFDQAAEPWNYSGPYRRLHYGVAFNRQAQSVEERVALLRSEPDSYWLSKLTWSYLTRSDSPDMTVDGPIDVPTLQTLGVAALRVRDPEFVNKGRTLFARVPATGKSLPFQCWIRKEAAPLAYVLPGLGSHRLSTTALVTAEHLHRAGFSVAVVSSVFHPEFLERASTVTFAGHPPTDTRDLLAALGAIDHKLDAIHGAKLGSRSLVGCSMGGFHALYLAAGEHERPPDALRFERYVAVNPPVELHHGVRCLDAFQDAPLDWPASERQQRIDTTVHKVGGLARLPPNGSRPPPFSATESKYLIGLTFRIKLRDALYSGLSRLPQAGCPVIGGLRREDHYREISRISYRDYASSMLLPYFAGRGIGPEDFKRHTDLRSLGTRLRGLDKTRVITNRNDFLLRPEDREWCRSVFRGPRLKMFPGGGHLGNLADPAVGEAIAELAAASD